MALRCQSGEPDAFEDLVHVMERPLLYYATKLLGNEERAIDALQDVWIRVFRGIRRLKDPGSLRPTPRKAMKELLIRGGYGTKQ